MNYKVKFTALTGGFREGEIVTADDLDRNGIGVVRALELGAVEETDEARQSAVPEGAAGVGAAAAALGGSDLNAPAVGTDVSHDHPTHTATGELRSAVEAPRDIQAESNLGAQDDAAAREEKKKK